MVQILDELSEAIYVADMDNHDLLYMNKAARKTFRVKDSAATKCHEVLHGRKTPCPSCSIPKLKEGEVLEREYTSTRNHRHYLLKDKIVRWQDKKARMEVVLDITNQKIKMKEIENIINVESFIIGCIKILHHKRSLKENINSILAETGLFLQANRTYIFDFDLSGRTMSNTYEWCSPNSEPQLENLQELPLEIIPNWLASFNRNEYVYIPDVDALPDKTTQEYRTLAAQDIKSLIAVPLMQEDGELLGFIGVDDPSPLQSVNHIQFLFNTLSFFIVSMLEQHRIRQKLVDQSFTDSLTDLQNRNKFISDTEKIKGLAAGKLGVAYIDLNDLKILNDGFGHERGDDALRSIAAKMLELFRKKDLYRIGGDEFVILCVEIPEDVFARKMRELSDFAVNGKGPSFALGYKWFGLVSDLDRHLKEADALMYENKREYHAAQNRLVPG